MVGEKRQKSAIPNMNSDGEFIRPIPVQGCLDPEQSWHTGLNPWQRLNSHHTYSSVRRNVNFKPFRIMYDHLDLVLKTSYQHGNEVFPDPIDIYFQEITIKSTKPLEEPKKGHAGHALHGFGNYGSTHHVEPKTFKQIKKFVLSKKLYPEHPLIIGGIKERIHPSSVKLMNSSHHSPQTNAGYVRQDRDGMVFYY